MSSGRRDTNGFPTQGGTPVEGRPPAAQQRDSIRFAVHDDDEFGRRLLA
jgi:hypothetical protein